MWQSFSECLDINIMSYKIYYSINKCQITIGTLAGIQLLESQIIIVNYLIN